MVGTKITHQRMENQMVGRKIIGSRVGQCKNSLPKGWTDGELNCWHENDSTKDGKSNVRDENNSPKG